MPWARLDDNAIANPKLLTLSDTAWRVWASGLVYCADKLTDGFVPECALSTFGIRGNVARAVGELLRPWRDGVAPLWSATDGGYQVHDYLQWNDSRADVVAERERKKRNMTAARDRLVAGNTPATNHGPSPSPSPSLLPSPSEKAPKLTKEDEQPSSPVKVLVDRYHDMLAKNLGIEKVDANWPKVATVLKRKIEEHTAKVVGPALTKFMADKDPFLVERAWEIGLFTSRFNRYISKATISDGGAAAGLAAAEETRQKLKKAFEDV